MYRETGKKTKQSSTKHYTESNRWRNTHTSHPPKRLKCSLITRKNSVNATLTKSRLTYRDSTVYHVKHLNGTVEYFVVYSKNIYISCFDIFDCFINVSSYTAYSLDNLQQTAFKNVKITILQHNRCAFGVTLQKTLCFKKNYEEKENFT